MDDIEDGVLLTLIQLIVIFSWQFQPFVDI